jgi:Holliday junction DNA helicase RuvA
MISQLYGSIIACEKDGVIIDVHGVGYSVSVPARSIENELSVGLTVRMHTVMIVRQDAMELFGFTTTVERELFRMLLRVSGVGPKVALAILSALPAGDLALALIEGDNRRLESVSGVGKKTAGRLIVELKDKPELMEYCAEAAEKTAEAGVKASEVVKMLESLGCTAEEARKAVKSALKREGKAISTEEELLAVCLEILGRK